ncbi:MAG: hypothetical protein ACT6RD_06750 [Brevundimonas sp.]|uniref:hypothetical protein n=1 Tax=Brevundimonas sp. TaxID=1871086 RepID=UPI004034C69D
MLNRRTLLIAATLLTTTGMARAETAAVFTHRGFIVDMTALEAARRDEIGAYVRQQIDLVESLDIRPEIKTWFRDVRITLNPALNMPGRFGPSGLELDDSVSPPDNPVLLHELLHGYQRHLPGGGRTPTLVGAFEAAKAGGQWPARAYMLSNLNEYFAMTASVMLWGRAARPPFTRARLVETQPDYAAWLTEVFGLKVV